MNGIRAIEIPELAQMYHVAPEMLKGLMERNPGLRSLSTDSKTCLEQAMQTLPNQLTTLKVRISLPITDALHILTAFPRLKTLYLSDNTRSSRSLMRESQEGLVGDATAVRGLPLPLRFLKVTTLSGAAQLSEILEQSPDLQHLHVQESEWIDEATLGMLRSGYFVRLTSLVLGHYAGSAIELVKAIPPHQLRDISIIDPHEPCMLQAVAEHQGQRLEHLELSFRYERVHGLMGLLAQCPALRSLRVNGNAGCLVNTQCLLKQPWACVLLEDLKIPLALPRWAETLAKQGPEVNPTDVMPEVPEWQQAEMHLMKQLGALTRLRRLDATTDLTFDTDETMDLTWCLNAGLGFLAKLEKLEVLDVSGQQYVQGITELQWMKKYLKKLSKLVVRMIGVQEKNWLCNHWPDLKVRDLDINPFEDY
ncbi:hypothetical protein DFQ27_001859 [Actinomortierella ambigua]|uniref:Uncharacterized protein n=1 Tax=Actinomortierella ambigua TaxID=1343610 RepID=A0A9P6U7U3_9FUNG|nr:hypothetical protein DFQ27_001859 [Actinomortierella ambigua]